MVPHITQIYHGGIKINILVYSYFSFFVGKDAERSSTLDRALGFFQENNENYKVSWAEANEKIALGQVNFLQKS